MKSFTKIQNEKDITSKYYVDSQTNECVKFVDKGNPDGVASLGSDGKVPYSQLPDFVKSEDKGAAGGGSFIRF